MVKVNESKPEDQLEHSPQSFLSIDESFVVLERSPSQESNDQFASHMLQQPPVYSAVPPRSSYTGGLSRQEGQVSTILTSSPVIQGRWLSWLISCYQNENVNFRILEAKVYSVVSIKILTLSAPPHVS